MGDVTGGSEVISPSGKPIPNHNPIEEITSDPLGPMIGQGPGGPEKAFIRHLSTFEGPDKDLRGLIRSLKGCFKRSTIICGRFSIK